MIESNEITSGRSTLKNPSKKRTPHPNLIIVDIPDECERPNREFMEQAKLGYCRWSNESTTSTMLEIEVPFSQLERANGFIMSAQRVERDTEP